MLYATLIIVMAIVVTLIAFKGRPKDAVEWFKDHPNVLKGIVLFCGAGIVIGLLTGCSAFPRSGEVELFPRGEVFLGVDYPFNRTSPQCEPDGPSDKWTSNGGVRVVIAEYDRLSFGGKYTHHSCAFNEDRELYDALGAEAILRLW